MIQIELYEQLQIKLLLFLGAKTTLTWRVFILQMLLQ